MNLKVRNHIKIVFQKTLQFKKQLCRSLPGKGTSEVIKEWKKIIQKNSIVRFTSVSFTQISMSECEKEIIASGK